MNSKLLSLDTKEKKNYKKMEMFYDLKKNPNFRRPLNAALSDSLLAQFTKPIENDGLNQQTETRTLLKKLRALFPPLYKSN